MSECTVSTSQTDALLDTATIVTTTVNYGVPLSDGVRASEGQYGPYRRMGEELHASGARSAGGEYTWQKRIFILHYVVRSASANDTSKPATI